MVYAEGGGWVYSITVRVLGDGVAGRLLFVRGGFVSVMERIRRRSRPDWSVLMVGWHSNFFHVVVLKMSDRLMDG
jgi:hypothetical protein